MASMEVLGEPGFLWREASSSDDYDRLRELEVHSIQNQHNFGSHVL
jgi:hypothetical protein